MTLAAGARLGPYAIVSALGAGGMGEVYRARDTRLDRDVAIKILPDVFAHDPERLARFEREAKTLASLNHPNVGQVYGLEESAGVRALVMELVDGDDLSVLIARGPIPLADALPIAKQIADALEAAHELGVVHRDVKPANVKVRADGTVKVLDFGLAKALDPTPASNAGAMNSPTLTARATELGMILGTAAYMSPEQARGKAVDRRADIWAFGVVLYEMLTGQRLFKGEEISDVLAAVLRQDIDWTALPADTPPRLRRLLERCIDRDAKTRLRDIGEARVAIQQWLANPTAASDLPASLSEPRRASRLGTVALIVASVAIAFAAALALVHFRETPPEERLITTSLLPPDGAVFDFPATRTFPALSPDGRHVVFGARSLDGKSRQLWLRPLHSPTAVPLSGTEEGYFPFWSPDGLYVGFAVGNQLKKISVSGGLPSALANLGGPLHGASWSTTGVIVCGATDGGKGGGLQLVPAAGGSALPIGTVKPGTRNGFPWFLPDGRRFLYVSMNMGSAGDLLVGSLDEPNEAGTIVAHVSSNAMYAVGHLLYMSGNTLMAQPFDAARLKTQGEAVPIADRIPNYSISQTGAPVGGFAVSTTGLLLHYAGAGRTSSLRWMGRDGARGATLSDPTMATLFGAIEFSPDQSRLAVSINQEKGGGADLWIVDVARGGRTQFTFDPGTDSNPIFSHDSKTVIWNSTRKGGNNLYRKAADGTGSDELLYEDPFDKRATGISREGIVLYHNTDRPSATLNDLWVLPLSPEQPGGPLKSRTLLETKANDRVGQFSPDAKWVAYESDDTGQREIYAMPFPGPGKRVPISHGGGTAPRWRRDYKEIFYVAPNGDLMATEITVGNGTLTTGPTRKLFGGVITARGYLYDVFDDKGQKFIIVEEGAQEGGAQPLVPPLTLVQNWPALLRR